jgi:plasmid segregation protein ParM
LAGGRWREDGECALGRAQRRHVCRTAFHGRAIGSEIGEQISDLSMLEESIRTGIDPTFYGKPFDITEHLKIGKAKAEQFVSVLVNKVGSALDISNIILAGGGASSSRMYWPTNSPSTKSSRPAIRVSNVRGFQRAGQQFADQIFKRG